MERLPHGHVAVPSGTLVLIDFGCLSLLGDSPDAVRASLAAALASGDPQAQHGGLAFVAVRGLPPGRYPVTSALEEAGDYVGQRRDVRIDLGPGEVARSVPLGTIGVDTARVGLFDVEAIPAWNDHVPDDGLADVALWGRDQEAVAARVGAPPSPDGTYAFVDLPYADALRLAQELHALREAGPLRFAFDFRPHTHPFHLLAQARATPGQAGTLHVGGLEVCGWLTTWGDGWFPVALELDAAGVPVGVRVDFTAPADEDAG